MILWCKAAVSQGRNHRLREVKATAVTRNHRMTTSSAAISREEKKVENKDVRILIVDDEQTDR